jgi:hypothetical protein
MSYSYDRYERQRRQTYGASSRRSTLGYWVPLAFTVTAATIGLAAWIWSERRDDGDDDYDREDTRRNNDPPHASGHAGVGFRESEDVSGTGAVHGEDASMMARMSGALRRTPSPQQLFDGASRKVAAGVAAAGAVVGGALSSIREEDKRDFEDHSRWSEEAESRNNGSSTQPGPGLKGGDPTMTGAGTSSRQPTAVQQRPGGLKRKTVAIVVTSESSHDTGTQEETDYHQEHAVKLPRR